MPSAATDSVTLWANVKAVTMRTTDHAPRAVASNATRNSRWS